jgi:hypothetical protein
MFTLALLAANYPKKTTTLASITTPSTSRALRSDVHIIIACHRSAPAAKAIDILSYISPYNTTEEAIADRDGEYPHLHRRPISTFNLDELTTIGVETETLADTLRLWLQIVTPDCLFIMDNGNDHYPYADYSRTIKTDFTREVVRLINPAINYFHSSIGNKTQALYQGTLESKRLRPDVRFIIVSDNDVRPSLDILDSFSLLDERHKTLVIPIDTLSSNKNKKRNLWEQWQGLEYKCSDLAHNAYQKLCGPPVPHGAISGYVRDFFEEVIRKDDDLLFEYEDGKKGRSALRKNNIAVFAVHSVARTFCPTSFPQYYKQRVRSWEQARIYYSWKIFIDLLTMWPPSLKRIIGIKLYQLYYLFQTAADILRLPVFLLAVTYWQYWAVASAQLVVLDLLVMGFNYGKLRNHPDLKAPFGAIITYPIYKLVYQTVSVLGIFHCLFVFIPKEKKLIRINQQEAALEHQAQIADALGARHVVHRQLDFRPSSDLSSLPGGAMPIPGPVPGLLPMAITRAHQLRLEQMRRIAEASTDIIPVGTAGEPAEPAAKRTFMGFIRNVFNSASHPVQTIPKPQIIHTGTFAGYPVGAYRLGIERCYSHASFSPAPPAPLVPAPALVYVPALDTIDAISPRPSFFGVEP